MNDNERPINLDKANIEFGIGNREAKDGDPLNMGSDYLRLSVFLRDYENGNNYTANIPEWVYTSVKGILDHYRVLCVETGEQNV